MRIGILYICIGKYDFFWKDFYLSAERYFFQENSWTREYYVFTDSPSIYGEDENPRIHRIKQANMGWPDNTMKRFHLFLRIREWLKQETDYLFFFNANMEFKAPVGEEILPQEKEHNLVGVLHCWYKNQFVLDVPYERRRKSACHVPFYRGKHYFQGTLWGGTTAAVLQLCESCRLMIDTDKKNNIIPYWHDESAVNCYFATHSPKALDIRYNVSMCFFDNLLEGTKIIAKNKEHYFSLQELGRSSYAVVQNEYKLPFVWRMYNTLSPHIRLGKETGDKDKEIICDLNKGEMKKRVLFIMSNLAGGGAEKVLVDILQHMDYARYEVDLQLIQREGVHLKEVPDSVRILSDSRFKRSNLLKRVCTRLHISFKKSLLWKISALGLKLKKYDVIISFMEEKSFAFHYSLQKPKGCLNISWIHTDLVNFPWSTIAFDSAQDEQDAYQQMDRIVCVSNESKKRFCDFTNRAIPNEKVKVIYNLIDASEIRRKANLLKVKKKKFTIGYVGSLKKRPDRLICVARLFQEAGYDIDFWFVGDQGNRPELEALCHELQVDGRCTFWGYQENPYPYMKEMDVYVSTSDYEGLPLTVCEAFCLEKVVVATRTCGPTELLDADRYGLLVDFDDASIYQALKKLVDDPVLLHYYQSQAFERSRMFDTSKTMNEIYSLFEKNMNK